MQLLERIAAAARDRPSHVAYLDPVSVCALTYGELWSRIEDCDVGRFAGRAIVLHAANTLDVPVWLLAAIAGGVDVLMMNDSATAAEVDALAECVGAAAIVSTTLVGDLGRPIVHLDRGAASTRSRSSAKPGTLLLATTGSTGIPKIVRRGTSALDAVARNMVDAIGFDAADRVLAAVPLTHSYGLEHGLLAPLWAGATVVLCAGLDLPRVTAAFAQGVTIFPAVPSMIEGLADVGEAVAGIEDVRLVYSAGGALPSGTRDRFTQRYRRAVGQLYGSTEVGTVFYRGRPAGEGDVGWPMRDVSVRILGIDDRSVDAATGDLGEVAIRSASMFEGYAAGEPSDLVDGHFVTGDLGRMTRDGTLVLEGRSRLLIDTGGLKVNPLEVERVLEQHPSVASCVVVAMRQSETVSRLRAVIVPRGAAPSLTAEEIRAFARTQLAPHKVPRAIEFRAELPRSATGKILRHRVEAS